MLTKGGKRRGENCFINKKKSKKKFLKRKCFFFPYENVKLKKKSNLSAKQKLFPFPLLHFSIFISY